MQPNTKWKQIKKIDRLDNIILYLISIGGNTRSYIYTVLNLDISEQAISERVKRLTKLGFVDSVDNQEKYTYRKYILTEQGWAFVRSLDLLSNILLLNLTAQNGELLAST